MIRRDRVRSARQACGVLFLCAALLVATLQGACGPRGAEVEVPDRGAEPPPLAPTLEVDPAPERRSALVLIVDPENGSVDDPYTFDVEIAATQARRERGLMGRETLGLQRGMLFVYRGPAPRSFWMKDCLIGLDIAFLDADGRILQVATLPPGIGLVGTGLPSAACQGPVKYVLELRAKRLAELGVGTGDLVDVRAATRGVDPD